MFDFLFNLIIKPLTIIYEVLFSLVDLFFYHFTLEHNYFLVIIMMSIIINIIINPLYKRADELSTEVRNKKESMREMVTHIKKHFKGDEQFFTLSAYYKEQNYKPIFALRESLSLLLQIPFFTAAFIYFTNAIF